MINRLLFPLLILLGLGLLVAYTSVFTVDEGQKAIKIKLGEVVRTDYQPGLYFKIPLIETVRKFDARLVGTETTGTERFLTSEKKNVIVDFFTQWRIADPHRYFTDVGSNQTDAAIDRLLQIIKDGLRSEFGKRTIQEVVSGERGEITAVLTNGVASEAAKLGIEVVDVRVMKIDLPSTVEEEVFGRMRSERYRIATELRAEGMEAAERIKSDADRQTAEIRADAYRDAEKVRGEGDAVAADVYAKAYGRDPEFYSFYRSLAAYRQVLSNRQDVMVIDPNSEFFRYFNSAQPKP